MHYQIEMQFGDYGSCDSPTNGDAMVFLDGSPIKVPVNQPLICSTDYSGGTDFADLVSDELPVISKRFAQALRDSGVSNFEVFPVDLMNFSTKERWPGFLAINIIGRLKCVHLGESQGTHVGGGMVMFRKITLRKDVVHNHRLFRIAESPSKIVIHESVKRHLDSISPPLIGIDYIPLAESL